MIAKSSTLPNPNGDPPAASGSARQPRRRWLWIALVLALAGGVWFFYAHSIKGAAAEATKGKGAVLTIPVTSAAAVQGEIGVYLTGLGSVTPLNTVTIKTRVDGQLMKVLFKEGQLVKEGDLLAEIDARPYEVQLDQAQGQLLRDEAAAKNALIDLERYKALFTQDAVPQQTLATQESVVAQSEGTIKSDQAQVDSAKLNITYCHITAPIGGVVGLRAVDAGNMVHASDANGLLVVAQIQPITVVFTIAEDNLPPILKKLNAGEKLGVEAYDRAMKTKLADGTILAVDNQISQTTGTLRLKALFPNDDRALFPNQFVNARLLVEMKREVTLVPAAAIQRGAQGLFVYVIKPDQTVAVRPVTVGTTEGEVTEIQKGLAVGESVVIDGVDKLQEGKAVLQVKSDKARGK